MFEKYFKDYLKEFTQTSELAWSYEAGVVLLGAKGMYEATGQDEYFDRIAEYVNYYVLDDGTLKNLDTNAQSPEVFSLGTILCHLYEETKAEKYKTALETLMKMLLEHIQTSAEDIYYMSLPLYLEYETRYNEKENYSDVYSRTKNVRNLFLDDKLPMKCRAYDLMAMLEMYENSSEEVFEQHKQYSIWFKEALRGILPYQHKETWETAIVAYCILKGCRLGILLKEKYQHTGEALVQELLKQDLVGQDIGAVALAYAEFLKRSEVL